MRASIASVAALALLAGCASAPLGPSVAVMPAPNKPFAVFAEDQALCKTYADQEVAGGADAANRRELGTAAVGTLLGAGLGAAVGGGRGAAVGAAAGALGGTAIGVGGARRAQYGLQERYDIAYEHCMYSRGNQVPGFAAAAPREPYVPPPPPGLPPPR
jgi:uncharacterized protein YcfJ